jgi:hypothetical protein
VSKFRAKLFIGFWFLLISLGQAYPYAVVYAHTQEEQCSCNRKGHQCIHGCALKKQSHEGHEHHGNHVAMDQATHHSSQDHWVSPNCSERRMQKILSFQTEPFLPSPVQMIQEPPCEDFFLNPPLQPQGLLLSCDNPPPKGDEVPKDPA